MLWVSAHYVFSVEKVYSYTPARENKPRILPSPSPPRSQNHIPCPSHKSLTIPESHLSLTIPTSLLPTKPAIKQISLLSYRRDLRCNSDWCMIIRTGSAIGATSGVSLGVPGRVDGSPGSAQSVRAVLKVHSQSSVKGAQSIRAVLKVQSEQC